LPRSPAPVVIVFALLASACQPPAPAGGPGMPVAPAEPPAAPPPSGAPPPAPAISPDAGPRSPDAAAVRPAPPAPPDASPADAPPAVDPSAEIYDPERVPRFALELPPASVMALGQNPRAYVRGTFRYGDEVVNDVGVRLKGETNLRPLTRKAPFKIKFDEFVPDQTFRGLRRMTLNNMLEDPSFLAERLAYDFFRAAGLPAPRANSALVAVNGQPFGVYVNLETEDKTFLRRWFTSDAGNLYEEGQVDFLPGNEARFELETNEQRNDRADLRGLIAALQAARDESLLADLDASLDTTHFLRFTAAEAAVNQWDMYGYTRFYPNNFRLYHDPGPRRFVFIPWGMDMALKDFRGRGDHIGVFAPARQFNNPAGPVTGGLIFLRCLRSPACKARYVAELRAIVDLYEGVALDQLAQRYYQQIKPLVYADPRKEVSNAGFERGFATVLRIIRERPATIRAELASTP
jgi:spore coat protein CotH